MVYSKAAFQFNSKRRDSMSWQQANAIATQFGGIWNQRAKHWRFPDDSIALW